jgi:hypothetical protein
MGYANADITKAERHVGAPAGPRHAVVSIPAGAACP